MRRQVLATTCDGASPNRNFMESPGNFYTRLLINPFSDGPQKIKWEHVQLTSWQWTRGYNSLGAGCADGTHLSPHTSRRKAWIVLEGGPAGCMFSVSDSGGWRQ